MTTIWIALAALTLLGKPVYYAPRFGPGQPSYAFSDKAACLWAIKGSTEMRCIPLKVVGFGSDGKP